MNSIIICKKNKLMSVLHVSGLFLTMNFVNIVKLVCRSTATLIMLWLNSWFRIDTWKTYINFSIYKLNPKTQNTCSFSLSEHGEPHFKITNYKLSSLRTFTPEMYIRTDLELTCITKPPDLRPSDSPTPPPKKKKIGDKARWRPCVCRGFRYFKTMLPYNYRP